MATLIALTLAGLMVSRGTGSPLPSAAATATSLLPAHTSKGTPFSGSPYPAFNASDYPHHNFTGHDHHRNTTDDAKHCNKTVNGYIYGYGLEHEHKNETQHEHNGTHCHNETSHDSSPSGSAKLPNPDGEPHEEKHDRRRLHEDGYPFAELIARGVDNEGVPRYVKQLKEHASSSFSSSSPFSYSSSSSSSAGKTEHSKRNVAEEEDLPASVAYMEFHDKRGDSNEDDDDGHTSWELIQSGESIRSTDIANEKREESTCVGVAGGVLCKNKSKSKRDGHDDEHATSEYETVSEDAEVHEKRTLMDCTAEGGSVSCKPVMAKRDVEGFVEDEDAVPAHTSGLD